MLSFILIRTCSLKKASGILGTIHGSSPKTDAIQYIDSYLVQHNPRKNTPENIYFRPKTDAVLHIDPYFLVHILIRT